MIDLPTRPCGSKTRPGCGKPIVWGVGHDGTRIPLDPRAPVYRIVSDINGEVRVARDHASLVSHFATCAKANQFSGSKKSPQARTAGD